MNLIENIENYMKPEEIVVEAVDNYFSGSKFRKFSIEKEHAIQMGSDNRRADVVLIDGKGNLAAVAECKQIGFEGHGPDQLKSYLCATDTPFGIFANSTEPDDWEFYENLGRNQFKDKIARSEFEKRVVKTENNFLTRVLDFFRRSSRSKPSEPALVKPSPEPVPESTREHVKSASEPSSEPPVDYIIGDRPLQNERRENTVVPTLNGKPYYSEQNGFYWAANHQGIAECVPQHIKRIIHHEELEIAATRDELEEEIKRLYEEKVDLEEQKIECEQLITQRTQELAVKKEDFVRLEVQLQALTLPRSIPFLLKPRLKILTLNYLTPQILKISLTIQS